MESLQSRRDTAGRDTIDQIVRYVQRGRDVVVTSRGEFPLASLIDCAVASTNHSNPGHTLVVVPEVEDVAAIRSIRKPQKPRAAFLGMSDDTRAEARSLEKSEIVIGTTSRLIDHIRRGNASVDAVRACFVRGSANDSPAFLADLHFIGTKLDGQPSTVLCLPEGASHEGLVSELVRRPAEVRLEHSPANPDRTRKEYHKMEELPFDAESTAEQLRDIVRRIREDEDPAEMNMYRKFVRRNVSVFHRGYFMAYLFKQGVLGETDSGSRKSVFVSAGRNRRVHARDLVTLFTSADGVDRDDIGQIKVLDNYSFVEVEASKAQQAIDSLNGSDFRGRKLTVNYARRK